MYFAPLCSTHDNFYTGERRDGLFALVFEPVVSTRKFDRIVRHTAPTPESPGPELHHGQDLVSILGHRVVGLLPAMVLDELVGVVDALERARPHRCQRRLGAREEEQRRPDLLAARTGCGGGERQWDPAADGDDAAERRRYRGQCGMQRGGDGDTATLAEAEEVDLVRTVLELGDQRVGDDVVGDESDGDGQRTRVGVEVAGAAVDVQILRPLCPREPEWER